MRILFEGGIGVHYGQFYVLGDDLIDMTEAFAGQSNGLCGAGVPGGLFLITGTDTGTVGLRVERHDDEAPAAAAEWEEVVEVSYAAPAPTVHLSEWGGGRSRPIDLGAGEGGYRIRYCASGMAEAPHTAYGDPTPDRYLLQFWPDDPARPDAVLRQTTAVAAYWHDHARSLPPPPTPEQRAAAERRAQQERERRHEEFRRREEARRWGGRPPSERLHRVVGNVFGIAHLDRDLVDGVAEADPATQRRIAHWAARHAYAYAGIADLDWLAPAWRALDRGDPLPDWCADIMGMYRRVEGRAIRLEAQVSVRSSRSGEPRGADLFPDEVARVPAALPALAAAALPDPLQAALEALWAAATAYGTDVPVFLAEVRRVFPVVAAVGGQSGDGSSRSRL